MESKGMADYFGEILIPQESVVELVKGKSLLEIVSFFPAISLYV